MTGQKMFLRLSSITIGLIAVGLLSLILTGPISPAYADGPTPLPRECGGDTGDGLGTCCAFGYVYYNGVPVAGVVVTVESLSGTAVVTTTTGEDSAFPYYRVSLNQDPLYVSPDDTITLHATYNGLTTSLTYQVVNDGQQVDMVLVEPPNFGTGRDGDLIVETGVMTYANDVYASVVGTAIMGQQVITVAHTSGFIIGDEALIIQMQGIGAGNYEFGVVEGIGNGILRLENPLRYSYQAVNNSKVQVLRVPHYRTVIISGTLTAPAWDGATGGVLALRTQGVFTAITGSVISMVGKGYRGGVGYPAQSPTSYGHKGEGSIGPSYQRSASDQTGNGSGGGAAGKSDSGQGGGAGGGGNGTPGVEGKNNVIQQSGFGGNATGDATLSNLFMGGGGGSGALWQDGQFGGISGSGGNGGGIIYLSTSELRGFGSISVNGVPGESNSVIRRSGGGAGGGAGGSIYLIGQILNLDAGMITAIGGKGGRGNNWINGHERGADGGNGGEGWIRIVYDVLHFNCDNFCGVILSTVINEH